MSDSTHPRSLLGPGSGGGSPPSSRYSPQSVRGSSCRDASGRGDRSWNRESDARRSRPPGSGSFFFRSNFYPNRDVNWCAETTRAPACAPASESWCVVGGGGEGPALAPAPSGSRE